MKLIVINPFGNYERGQEIVDAAEVEAILASDAAGHVVKAPKPAAKKPKK